MPLPIAIVLSLVFHLAAYTLADRAGLRAPPPPPPRVVIEALLILPEPPPEPAAAPAAPPDVQPAVVVPPAAAASPATVPATVSPAPTFSPPAQATFSPRPPAPVPLFYPPAAVQRGIEGEVLVRVTLDAGGNVVAARLERGSGHAILDDAALVAARTLRSLPGGAGEATLPVRFSLK